MKKKVIKNVIEKNEMNFKNGKFFKKNIIVIYVRIMIAPIRGL